MIKLKIDGEVIEFKDWQEVHDDYVSKTNCNCRELEHWECAENELTDNHKWSEEICEHESVEYGQCLDCEADVSSSYNIYKNFQHND